MVKALIKAVLAWWRTRTGATACVESTQGNPISTPVMLKAAPLGILEFYNAELAAWEVEPPARLAAATLFKLATRRQSVATGCSALQKHA